MGVNSAHNFPFTTFHRVLNQRILEIKPRLQRYNVISSHDHVCKESDFFSFIFGVIRPADQVHSPE